MIDSLLSLLAAVNITSDDFNIPKGDLGQNTIANALQLVFGIAGAVALIIITIGAFQYVISQGNPQSTGKAKDTILYAIIGLVVCTLGYAIVGFVVNNVT